MAENEETPAKTVKDQLKVGKTAALKLDEYDIKNMEKILKRHDGKRPSASVNNLLKHCIEYTAKNEW